MGERHPTKGIEDRRVGLGEPGQLGNRERRDRDAADGIGPGCGPEAFDERVGLRRGLGVIPQLSRVQRAVHRIRDDHPVLLAPDGHRHDRTAVEIRGRLARSLHQRRPPGVRVLFTSRRVGRRMRRFPGAEESPGLEIVRLHLDGLGR
jgi:hypothetical protein